MATSILTEVRSDRPKKDGTFSIRLLITHNGGKHHITTPWSVNPQHYRKGKITDYRVNDYLHDYIRTLRLYIDELGMRANSMTIDEVVRYLQAKEESKRSFSLDFIAYTQAYAEKLKSEQCGTYVPYQNAINSLSRFLGKDSIDINALTTRLIQQWVDWFVAAHGARTIGTYRANLQAMHTRACREFNDEDNGIIRIAYNPFARVTLPRRPMAEKRALSPQTISAIINAPDHKHRNVNFTRDLFSLSFYLVGMNLADIFDVDASAYADGRLTYKRKKTRTRRADEALISIRVEPEAARLIEKYRAKCGDKLFEFSRHYINEKSLQYVIAYGLRELCEYIGVPKFTFYAARHSWATIAVNDLGIDKYVVHEALNHADPTMKITDMYIRKDWRRVDEANRAVLDYIHKLRQ